MSQPVEHRVLRLWINKQGKIKRDLLSSKVNPETVELDKFMPSEAVCQHYAMLGYTFCNCHIIEVPVSRQLNSGDLLTAMGAGNPQSLT